LPHLLPLHAVSPVTAAATWLGALALRALAGIGAVVFIFVYLPQTNVFRAIAEWCWHAVIPLLTEHLGLSGHAFADAALTLPALALAASLLWVLFGIARAAITIDRRLSRGSRRPGPFGSTIVDHAGVVVAVAGLGRARVVVSEAALGMLDREELEASLAHEVAHIRRGHRQLLLLGAVLAALGRWLPGTATAERELAFSLERDADEFAVRQGRDPHALASAICKAAGPASIGAAPRLGGRGRVALRLECLLAGGGRPASRLLERSARAVALVLTALTLLLTATLPSWALAVPNPSAVDQGLDSCPH
jgi:Zn-dependent protease with chaperone function